MAPAELARIVEQEPGKPVVRRTGTEVLQILQLMAGSVPEDEILRRFPGLEREDLRACVAYAAELAPGSRAPELEQLIARRFPPEGRKERAERAGQAVREFCGSFASKVDPETVKWVAQDADILDI